MNVQARFDLAVVLANISEALTQTGRADDGTEMGRKALGMFQELVEAEPENMVYRRNLGLSYVMVARSHVSRAESSKGSTAARAMHWREARACYREALGVFTDLRERGALRPSDAGQPDELAVEVSRCDKALARP